MLMRWPKDGVGSSPTPVVATTPMELLTLEKELELVMVFQVLWHGSDTIKKKGNR